MFLERACLAGWVTRDRGARADLEGAAETEPGAEGGGRQEELLATGFERPKMELDIEGLAGAGIDRDKLDPGRGILATVFELEGFPSPLDSGWKPVRLGGRAFSLDEDDAELEADNGR